MKFIKMIKQYGKGTDFGTVYDLHQRRYYIYDARNERKRYFDVTDFDDFMDAVEEVMWHRGHEEYELEFGGKKQPL